MVGHVLDQAAAREDVDGLQAAADAEDGHGPSLGFGPAPRVQLVARGVQVCRAGHRLVVKGGVDIGAAGQQQPGHLPEEPVACRRRRGRGDENGVAAVVPDRVRVQLGLVPGEGRVRRTGGVGGSDDDQGLRGGIESGWHARQHTACAGIGRNAIPRAAP